MSIYGTWFPFYHSYCIERLDDQDYEPIISSNRCSPPGCARIDLHSMNCTFNLTGRKEAQFFSLFLSIMTNQIQFLVCKVKNTC